MAEARRKSQARIPTLILEGDSERTYVNSAVAIIRQARLNSYYPNAKRLAQHLSCLAPDLHRGLYPHLQIDKRSGLPTYREWTRAKTDVEIARKALVDIGPLDRLERRHSEAPESIYGKQLLKHGYYTALCKKEIISLSQMHVALRRVDVTEKTAHFRVILDKLDVSGLFVRYTIDLGQQSSAWQRPAVTLDKETAAHTDEFMSLIYKFTSLDSEFTFAKLVSMGGLTVERVIKGTVGPLCFAGVSTVKPLANLIQREGDFIANFALDTAAVDITVDKDNDPINDLMAETLSPAARRTYEASRAKYGYKIFKDRKFVVSASLADSVHAYCKQAGTRNIVYRLRS